MEYCIPVLGYCKEHIIFWLMPVCGRSRLCAPHELLDAAKPRIDYAVVAGLPPRPQPLWDCHGLLHTGGRRPIGSSAATPTSLTSRRYSSAASASRCATTAPSTSHRRIAHRNDGLQSLNHLPPSDIIVKPATITTVPEERSEIVLRDAPFHSPRNTPRSVEKKTAPDISTAKEM